MQYIYEPDTLIPLSDGVNLCANVWRPAEGTAPTLLMRLPYGKDTLWQVSGDGGPLPSLLALLRAGYAVVMQDVRGAFRSEGVFTPKVNEQRDGRETIEWIARQRWSDGTVGTYGASYMGMTRR